MSRRIDVELTSVRDDGTWTWRAAGARQPKGVVGNDVLYGGAKVGDVVTAEADFDVDGITILSVTPPKAKAGRNDLLELTGSGDEFEPVITNWNEKRGGRDRDPYGEKTPRGDRPGGGGGARGGPGGPGGGNRGGPRPTADWRARVAPPAPAGGDRSERGRSERGRPQRGGDSRRGGSAERGDRPDRGSGDRPDRGQRRDRPVRDVAAGGGGTRSERPDNRPKPKRLSPASTHRDAVLETLPPEQRPVAEQLLRGGIPAVRRAIADQNQVAKAAGQPEIKPDSLLALAEELQPRLKTAEWHDRAEAAQAIVDEIGLRDLRSVVSGADAARDDETRALAASLRESLERRVKEQQDAWLTEISSAMTDGRLVRALRLSSRPPDPTTRLPADVAGTLSAAASEAMAPDTPPERWAALLEAVAASPVRTTVKPAGLPTVTSDALRTAAGQQAGRIPALTGLLGISMPPPPGPVRRIPPKPVAPVPQAVSAPPTPVHDDPPAPAPTPPQATEPVAPAAPAAAPIDDAHEAPVQASVVAEPPSESSEG